MPSIPICDGQNEHIELYQRSAWAHYQFAIRGMGGDGRGDFLAGDGKKDSPISRGYSCRECIKMIWNVSRWCVSCGEIEMHKKGEEKQMKERK